MRKIWVSNHHNRFRMTAEFFLQVLLPCSLSQYVLCILDPTNSSSSSYQGDNTIFTHVTLNHFIHEHDLKLYPFTYKEPQGYLSLQLSSFPLYKSAMAFLCSLQPMGKLPPFLPGPCPREYCSLPFDFQFMNPFQVKCISCVKQIDGSCLLIHTACVCFHWRIMANMHWFVSAMLLFCYSLPNFPLHSTVFPVPGNMVYFYLSLECPSALFTGLVWWS